MQKVSWRHCNVARRAKSGIGKVICSAASPQTRIVFSVPKRLMPGESLRVVGNVASMGSWNHQTAVVMEHSSNGCWFAEVDVDPGQRVEYKFFIERGEEESPEWQKAEDFYVDVPNGSEGADLIITDTWEGKKRAVSWQGLLRPLKAESRLSSDPATSSTLLSSGSLSLPHIDPSQQSSSQSNGQAKTMAANQQANVTEPEQESSVLPSSSLEQKTATERGIDDQSNGTVVSGKATSQEHANGAQKEAQILSGLGEDSRTDSEAQASENGPGRQFGDSSGKSNNVISAKSLNTEGSKKNERSLERMTVKALRTVMKGLGLPVRRRKADMIEDIIKNKD